MTPVKQKEEDQSKVTPTKTSPCKVANEAVAKEANEAAAKEAKGAHTVEKAIVPKAKAKAKAAIKDTSKADHGGDNATEAGVAPKRKASNGVADSEAPKKRPAAKGHRSRARIPVPAMADEATTMEVEPKLEPELEPEVSGDAFGTTGPKLAGADSEVSEVSGVAEVPGGPVPVLEEEATPMELETELPEVVSEVPFGFLVSGFDSVDNASGGGAAAGTVDDSSQGEGAAGEGLCKPSEWIPQQLSQCQKKPELHGQEAPVTPVNALEAQHSDGEGSSQATTLILGQTPPKKEVSDQVPSSSKGEPKVSDDDMPKRAIFAARYCPGSADGKLSWTRLQRIFNELAPEDERLRETERAAWKYVKENNDDSFKCTEDKMKELTILFFEMWAAKRQA